ncbi:MAG: hypothetical protein HC913_13010 [Microscillaceae bacterium]|nr:hypothetical protein [Microscillaceae bacterium]
MIQVKMEVLPEQIDSVVALLQNTPGVQAVHVEDPDDVQLKPMTATDFYKRINASNLAQKENRIFSQEALEKEVQSW